MLGRLVFPKTLARRHLIDKLVLVAKMADSSSSCDAKKPPWKIGQLNHVAVACTDLASTVDFYRTVLGCTVSEIKVNHHAD